MMKYRHLLSVKFGVAATVFVSYLVSAEPAWAHAFGIRYDLPLPLWLYLSGAGAAVALSFAIMTLFVKNRSGTVETASLDLLSLPGLGWLGHAWMLNFIRLMSVSVFGLLLVAGLFGNPDPFRNISPVFVWVIWWVGMAFISTIAGNLWDLLNPWRIISTWTVNLWQRSPPARPYPAWLDRWPAVALFGIFAWLELIAEHAEQPRTLALVIIVYSVITWAGAAYYGRDAWFRHGEVFTVVFSLLARVAPFHGGGGQWQIRMPAVGLFTQRPMHLSGVYFVLLLLTTVTFDGILETPLWGQILTWVSESQALRPALLLLQDGGFDLIVAIKTVALITLPALFVGAFFLTSKAVSLAGGGTITTRDVAGYFVLSLVPIAAAYHLSHYLSYLLIAGQTIIPILSDPFGVGWDLFGTTDYAVDIGIVNAKLVWYVSVSAIVVGHVAAIYVAHVMAQRVFPTAAKALASQIPMLALMVAYTMISLWILSQPIIA